MFLRKFLGFIITTLLTGLFLNFYFAIMVGYDKLFAALGVLLTGVAPFILLMGLPVSILSDLLTKNLNSKQRYKKAFLIHIIFGLIIGLVLSLFFEHLIIVVITLIATFIFWLVDEILRKKFKGTK
ncbi:hypothetical protein [Ureibacillus acetophenoni]|uniref:Uncharacterized protein n=1 Tax=Ureibacillus acetophenoni TaxID=614649 RepID=A0A285UTC1_9BACL|nr:hypothetical protein [Ureibacillus acetophenoni]SOC45059.1 hypothetical protein SAMN05877842_1297 [Ureibacillus acetophenoni]